MIEGNERIGAARHATMAVILLGTALLMIAPIGDVSVGGQERGLAGSAAADEGRRLFRKETFGGNGRTCETCHSRNSGTVSPAEV
jgi:cytochrome c peroxidase